MSGRTKFEDDLVHGLRKAARANLLAKRLKGPADRADCLRAAADFASSIGSLDTLRTGTAARLKTIRNHKRSRHAYSGQQPKRQKIRRQEVTLLPDHTSPEKLVTQYHAVLRELTDLAERERTHLERGYSTLPQALVCRKESLVEHYALLTVAVRERAGRLQADGLLDVTELDRRIRHLVALLEDNQRLLTALKVRTAERVEMVMNALAKKEADEKVAELPASKIAAGALAFRPPMRT